MGNYLAFIGMVVAVLAQVSSIIVSKEAMSRGLSEFVLVVYSYGISSIIILPISLIFHRSDFPPLNLCLISTFFFLGIIGGSGILLGYAGLQYSSATLNTALLNLIPAFTFLLTLIFRLEQVNLRRSSSVAKLVGTIVSISGAFVVTLYKGPAVIRTRWLRGLANYPIQILFSSQSHWILGGFLIAAEAFTTSLWYILQASILKKFPAVLIIIFFYCFFVTIQVGLVTLIVETDFKIWRIQSALELVAVLYVGVVGNALRFTATTWSLKQTEPLYVSMFKPLAVIVADLVDVIFFGQALYLGSLVGAVILVSGFYAVIWGKSKESKSSGDNCGAQSSNEQVPLMQNKTEQQGTQI